MNIELSLYRARIGCFKGRCTKIGSDNVQPRSRRSVLYNHGFTCTLMIFVLCCLALVCAGDVEVNPGPGGTNSAQGLVMDPAKVEATPQATAFSANDVSSLQSIMMKMNDNMVSRFDGIDAKLNTLASDVANLTQRIEKVETENINVKNENAYLRAKTDELEQKLDYLDNDNRGKNLVIGGMIGPSNEDRESTMAKVRDFFHNDLKMENVDSIAIDSVFRMKNAKPNVKPVLVKFTDLTSRKKVVDAARTELAGKPQWVKPDVSSRTRDIRRKLSKFYDDAITQGAKEIKVIRDYMLIDGQRYNYNTHNGNLERDTRSQNGK